MSERVSDISLGSDLATEDSTVASDSENNDTSQLEEAEDALESDGTATDGEWLPQPKKTGKQVIHSDPESEDGDKSSANRIAKSSEKTKGKAIDRQSDVLKMSKNARSSGGKKTPRVVPLPSHDVSVVYTPVIRPKGRDSERLSDDSDDSEPQSTHGVTRTEGEGNSDAPIVKKKKRFEKSRFPGSDTHSLN